MFQVFYRRHIPAQHIPHTLGCSPALISTGTSQTLRICWAGISPLANYWHINNKLYHLKQKGEPHAPERPPTNLYFARTTSFEENPTEQVSTKHTFNQDQNSQAALSQIRHRSWWADVQYSIHKRVPSRFKKARQAPTGHFAHSMVLVSQMSCVTAHRTGHSVPVSTIVIRSLWRTKPHL